MPTTIHGDSKAAGQRKPALALPAWQTEKLKLVLISVSIANLCFLFIWKQVLGLAEDAAMRYFQDRPPHLGMLLALIADASVLTLLVLGFGVLCGARNKRARGVGVAGLSLFGLLAFYQLQRFCTEMLEEWKPEQSWKILKIALACVLAFVVVRYPRRLLRFVIGVLLIVSPVFLVLALNGVWQYETNDLHQARNETPAPMLAGTRDRPHLVWIIFDELDDRMLFDVRPQRIQLREFDRLRAESVYGKALTPSTDTLWAMPSFFLGRRVVQVGLHTNRLLVEFSKGGPWVDASTLPNVFRSARAAGLNTGLVGWHHPYCRIFGNDLSDCSWMSFGGPVVRVEKLLRDRSFLDQAVYLVSWQARWSVPRIIEPLHWVAPEPEEARMWREQQISAMQFIVANASRMLRNPDLNLVFIHIPTPHPAGIWDTQARKFTLGNSDYIDNLSLADATLGQIRGLMEQTGEWNASTVLISGDHPYRTGMWMDSSIWTPEMARLTQSRWHPYVPLFLKLPGQHVEVDYTKEFNNVLSPDLALQILKGELKSPAEVVSWLDAHAGSSLR
ncbi:MAG TPA: hypothetical protein VHU83_21785 [Bryobacteraceae bacterium]|jgi:hypothetical protein|nr:hypothetical protein [Bryobacteraceae bacterium]